MVGVEKMEETSRNDSAAKMGNAQISPVEAQEAVSDLLIRFDALKAAGGALAPNFQAFVVNATAAFERLRSGRPLSRRERRQMQAANTTGAAWDGGGQEAAPVTETLVTTTGCGWRMGGQGALRQPDMGNPVAPLLTLDVQADTVAMRRVDYVDLVRELTTLRAQVEDLTARAATAGIKASGQRTYSEDDRVRATSALSHGLLDLGHAIAWFDQLDLVDAVAVQLGLQRA